MKTEIIRNTLRRLTGDGLVTVEGDKHRRQRKILTPAFASSHIRNLIPVFWRKTCEMKELLQEEAVKRDKKEYELFVTLTRMTLDVIGLAGAYRHSC